MTTPFCTEPVDKVEQLKLRKYVDNLNNKIDYAKWKQELVLNYNYMPLKNIKEKIQTERENYTRRMQEQQKRLIKQIDNKEMNNQLEIFRDFKDKLQRKMKQIQKKIDAEEMKIKVLSAEANDKKTRLKQLVKGNMNLTKTIYEHHGITTKKDLIKLARSQSTKERLLPLSNTKKNSLISVSKYDSQKTTVSLSDKTLYRECVEAIIGSLKNMKSSEDVQTGIYLDIMKKKQHSKSGKYSSKSNICHTLIDRYGNLRAQKRKKQAQDFEMSWETFRTLNWKQILGILLVKDRQGYKLSKLIQLRD